MTFNSGDSFEIRKVNIMLISLGGEKAITFREATLRRWLGPTRPASPFTFGATLLALTWRRERQARLLARI